MYNSFDIYIVKEHYHWLKSSQNSSTLKNSHYNHWSCLHCKMNLWLTSFAHLHFVVSEEFAREQNSDSAHTHCWLTERLWFLSSTESCVIGYNAQRCKNASVSGSVQPKRGLRFEFSSWWCAELSTSVIILHIKIYYWVIFCLLEAVFKIHLPQKWGHVVWMDMTPLVRSQCEHALVTYGVWR